MASTPEAKVKAAVKKLLDERGIYHFSPVQNGMGRAGIPDIIGCFNGRFLGIECKAGKGKTTALQDLELEKIRKAKGFTYVVNEHNLQDLKELLQWIS